MMNKRPGNILSRITSRRELIVGAAQTVMVIGASGLLAGCQTTPAYPEIKLSDLMIDDGNGVVRYLDVLGKIPKTSWSDEGLPLPAFSMNIGVLDDDAAWLKDFDFDQNYYLTRAEMTQGWLVQTARWKTGKVYAPDSLSVHDKTASILAQATSSSLKGFSISVDDERAVRGVIDGLAADGNAVASAVQSAIAATVSSINSAASSTSGGGGNGGDY